MMTPSQTASWRRIRTYDFPGTGTVLPFVARLARENRWSQAYAERVVDEYRRFCFLAMHADHYVTPSDQVDQAWHLHMLYSDDYWNKFCPQALGGDLHHGPTRGGQDEVDKFTDWYTRTLESYRRFFGTAPTAVWPSRRRRFKNADQFVRINTSETLLLDRKKIRHTGLAAGSLILAGTGMSKALAASDSGLSEFSLLVSLVVGFIVIAVILVIAKKKFTPSKSENETGGGGYAGGACGSKSSDSNSSSGDSGDGGGGGAGCGGCGA